MWSGQRIVGIQTEFQFIKDRFTAVFAPTDKSQPRFGGMIIHF
jgi:hypothetical protein